MYRNVQGLVQKTFAVTHTTSNHGAPDMNKTFQQVQERLAVSSPHVIAQGRGSRHKVEDLHDKGREMMDKAEKGMDITREDDDDDGRGSAEMDDIMVDLLQ